jgi:MoxR-like ATPase
MNGPHANQELEGRIAGLRTKLAMLREAIEASFVGHRELVDLLLYCVLCEGHALLEGAPGLGKTTLVKELAQALDLSFRRIQFTPDLMPPDILGTRILEESEGGAHAFRFERGPVFANIVLADEINRATPRTQSALLEAMQERQVTVFGDQLALPEPFCVVATQNPIEMEGTYPLPEAQLDRFLCKAEIHAPDESELLRILESTSSSSFSARDAVLGAPDVLEIRDLIAAVPVASDLLRWIARTVLATDPRREEAPEELRRCLRYGASPRGGQAVVLLAKARALASGRPWVTEEDVETVAAPALRHRLVFSYEGEASGVHPDRLVSQALEAARHGEEG